MAELEFPEGLLEAEEAATEDELVVGEAAGEDGTPATPKKRTRRGSRGGRRRRKPVGDGAEPADGPSVEEAAGDDVADDASADELPANGAVAEPKRRPARTRSSGPKIHVPSDDFGRDGETDDEGPAEEPGPVVDSEDPAAEGDVSTADGDTPAAPKKRTRRGSRGGRRRRKPAGAAASAEGADDAPEDGADELAETGADDFTATGTEDVADAGSEDVSDNGAVETALAEVVAEPTTPDES
jgi:ribonuclease E